MKITKITRLSSGRRIEHEIARCEKAPISYGSHDLRLEFNHQIISVTFTVDRYRITLTAAEVREAQEFITKHTRIPT